MANSREKKTRNVFTEKAALEQEIAALRESLSEQAKRLAQCRKEIEDAIVERIKRQEEIDALREENRRLMRNHGLIVLIDRPFNIIRIMDIYVCIRLIYPYTIRLSIDS